MPMGRIQEEDEKHGCKCNEGDEHCRCANEPERSLLRNTEKQSGSHENDDGQPDDAEVRNGGYDEVVLLEEYEWDEGNGELAYQQSRSVCQNTEAWIDGNESYHSTGMYTPPLPLPSSQQVLEPPEEMPRNTPDPSPAAPNGIRSQLDISISHKRFLVPEKPPGLERSESSSDYMDTEDVSMGEQEDLRRESGGRVMDLYRKAEKRIKDRNGRKKEDQDQYLHSTDNDNIVGAKSKLRTKLICRILDNVRKDGLNAKLVTSSHLLEIRKHLFAASHCLQHMEETLSSIRATQKKNPLRRLMPLRGNDIRLILKNVGEGSPLKQSRLVDDSSSLNSTESDTSEMAQERHMEREPRRWDPDLELENEESKSHCAGKAVDHGCPYMGEEKCGEPTRAPQQTNDEDCTLQESCAFRESWDLQEANSQDYIYPGKTVSRGGLVQGEERGESSSHPSQWTEEDDA
ncbi:hypothetical protein GMORB2_1772 [Geosmithia morbida]|uniref:Uncharacterized protein n=1 Tax=Geosmithia morbida TaxID=1094350 RepID=A0A9P4YSX0_9HYPO|nr:uncharacterized protein GMORB2_1772 [Geosmithia morbida]KAF4121932.1 hypothetical protein GMORB2_1772 [Geosmithia morbida]